MAERDCIEFDCCECGRHIISVTAVEPPEPRLCGACLYSPGWFRIPGLRVALDPSHDGMEAGLTREGVRW